MHACMHARIMLAIIKRICSYLYFLDACSTNTCMHVCMYACTKACKRALKCMHTYYTNACMHACMHACILYKCMHKRMHAFKKGFIPGNPACVLARSSS